MLLKTTVTVEQLRIYRAVAIWCSSESTDNSVDVNENIIFYPTLVTRLANLLQVSNKNFGTTQNNGKPLTHNQGPLQAVTVKLKPKVDHRFDGIPETIVQEDQESFPEDGTGKKPWENKPRKSSKNRDFWNSRTMSSAHCHRVFTSLHVHCQCGRFYHLCQRRPQSSMSTQSASYSSSSNCSRRRRS